MWWRAVCVGAMLSTGWPCPPCRPNRAVERPARAPRSSWPALGIPTGAQIIDVRWSGDRMGEFTIITTLPRSSAGRRPTRAPPPCVCPYPDPVPRTALGAAGGCAGGGGGALWMDSVAWSSTCGGMVRPKVWAVWRLITEPRPGALPRWIRKRCATCSSCQGYGVVIIATLWVSAKQRDTDNLDVCHRSKAERCRTPAALRLRRCSIRNALDSQLPDGVNSPVNGIPMRTKLPCASATVGYTV